MVYLSKWVGAYSDPTRRVKRAGIMVWRKVLARSFLVCALAGSAALGYEYDANDFALWVAGYDAGQGAGYYTDPWTAVGRPSVDTDYWGSWRPVVTVYPEWLPTALVTVGVDGKLILKFDHRLADDRNNAYGIDFIVFGNGFQTIGGLMEWTYGEPNAVRIKTGQVESELGRVSVSQDGLTWYSFEHGPWADSFAPTLGRVYNPNEPNTGYPGWENLWWGQVTNPTMPLDPNTEPGDFNGVTVAEMSMAYGESAGGTGFDLKWLDPNDYEALAEDVNTSRKWIRYVKIECTATNPEDGPLPEVDAVSDVSCCGDWKHRFPAGDVTGNCMVDMADVLMLSEYWLWEVTDPNAAAGQADVFKDGWVDFKDFAVLGGNWQMCTWGCE